MATTMRCVIVLLMLGGSVFGETQPTSCMVRLFTTAGLSLRRAQETEKNLAKVNLSPKQLGHTPPHLIQYLLKVSGDEAAAIQRCIGRKSDACKKLVLCENQGRCILEDSAKAYSCQCLGHFTGSFCEHFKGIAGVVQSLGRKVDMLLQQMKQQMKQQRSDTASLTERVDLLAKWAIDVPRSCKEIQQDRPTAPSGTYTIRSPSGTVVKVHCDMDREGGGWTRVAHINPAATSHCPGELKVSNPGTPLCIRSKPACAAATFESAIGSYSEIMGFVTGYRDKSADAFIPFKPYGTRSIDGAYVDGVSITHGSPRSHVWSYASSFSDSCATCHCPCSARPGEPAPSFVGDHYYCNDLGRIWDRWTINPSHNLWSSSSKCAPGGSCCANSKQPWFTRRLGKTTSDSIQLRVCLDESKANEDIGVDRSEIYVR